MTTLREYYYEQKNRCGKAHIDDSNRSLNELCTTAGCEEACRAGNALAGFTPYFEPPQPVSYPGPSPIGNPPIGDEEILQPGQKAGLMILVGLGTLAWLLRK